MTMLWATSTGTGCWRAVLHLLWVFAWALLVVGCRDRSQPDQLVARAQFGIFFGGQLQERKEIPFELDRSKQKHGIRIEFTEPLRQATKISWELDMPGEGKRVRDETGRIG